MSVKGSTALVEQVDSSYVVKSDGLVEASLTFQQLTGPDEGFGGGQASSIDSASVPEVGDEHPDVVGLLCTSRTVIYGDMVTTYVCDFLGIDGKETERFLAYNAGVNSENIDAHPRFDEIAGTPSAPVNGAVFDDNGQFTGFENTSDLAGESNYYSSGASVEVTYYTFNQPSLANRMKIYDTPNMGDNYFQKPNPQDTVNYLLTDTPYREVIPGTGLYQVTEQYLQSGDQGWNTRIYVKGATE